MNPADPLSQLKDIRLPPPPGFWPPAPGWWMLAVLIGALVVFAVLRLRAWRRARFRQQELKDALDACWLRFDQHGDAGKLAGECNAWLRRAALARFPQQGVPGLAGDDWLAFLDKHGGGGGFSTEPGCVLRDAAYQRMPDIDARSVFQLTRHWVLQHAF